MFCARPFLLFGGGRTVDARQTRPLSTSIWRGYKGADVRVSASFHRGGWEVRWRDASGRRRARRFPSEHSYRKLVMSDGKIAGAIVIARPQDPPLVTGSRDGRSRRLSSDR
jgi:hypothetical protein